MESKANDGGSSECDSDGSGGTRYSHEEGDGVNLVGLQSSAFRDEQKSNSQGIYLNTKLVGEIASREDGEKIYENHRQVIPVTVVFDLPDGSQVDQEFQMGQTVEVLKGFVESEIGIPMSRQDLYLGSTLMMDPMSLLDYPEVECGSGEVLIAVEGDMIEEARK